MRRSCATLVIVLLALASSAQFPLVRALEVRNGQRRPAIERVAQDGLGMLWVTSDVGLIRTDGDRVEVILPAERERAVAITPRGYGVMVVTASGLLLRCGRDGCDTLLARGVMDERAPVRCMVVDEGGTLWMGTYGKGVARYDGKGLTYLDASQGLPDDHVNALDVLPDGRLVVATDQGLAICVGGNVVRVMGEAEGAPDNLTLSVSVADDGTLWAGTDRSGVYQWRYDSDTAVVSLVNADWTFGPVKSLCSVGNMVWAGTSADGPIAIDRELQRGTYRSQAFADRAVHDLLVDVDGAVWWCDGTEVLHRADPGILIVPEHEGLDLRHITALCADKQDRIWFATPDGLFQHVAWFSEERTVTRVPLPLDPRNPIVSLAAAPDGTVWAGTFGGGVIAMLENGTVFRYTSRDGLPNDNVLAARSGSRDMWFATLEGVTRFDGTAFIPTVVRTGFTFDVTEHGGDTYVATDGRGVLRFDSTGAVGTLLEGKTCYALVHDLSGGLWTAGPGTGFCRLAPSPISGIGASGPPFDGDVFGMGTYKDQLIAFGSTGVTAYDPGEGTLRDVTAGFGLAGVTAELNAVASDRSGALWFACSEGLVRLRPGLQHFQRSIPISFLSVTMGAELVDMDSTIRVAHDRSTFTVRFTGLHYVDPSAVRFEYRLLGQGDEVVRTRDRELTFPGLHPGNYTFQLRAFTGEEAGNGPWSELHFTIARPWWRTTWALLGGIVLIGAVVLLVVRERERRLRDRERMEQEKVRFQLDALRSKVDPHFLFNSFTALVELIETDPQVAVEHVDQLSIFFRNILLVRDRERITVHEEVRLLENYFELEQRRFGKAIELRVQLDENAMDRGVVPLTLQLLVENALKHNVITSDRVFLVTVRSERDGLVVSNAIRPRSTPPRSTGFGLHSIVARYAALSTTPVSVRSTTDEFSVWLPLIDPNA